MPKKKFTRKDFLSLIGFAALALTIRAVLVEPFKIPSSSMVPTLLIGDHIFVNKLAYGLRIPFTRTYLKEFRDPERGEVVVFVNPDPNDGRSFIKRVIGLAGDTVEVRDFPGGRHEVTVNGERLPAELKNEIGDFLLYEETVGTVSHLIQHVNGSGALGSPLGGVFQVPAGHFFVMGDNRDMSSDSRVWGFVPRDHLRGRAMVIWLSWDSDRFRIRWDRFGDRIR